MSGPAITLKKMPPWGGFSDPEKGRAQNLGPVAAPASSLSAGLSLKSMAKTALLLAALMAIAIVPHGGREIAFGLLIAASLRSPEWALKSLIAGTLVIFMNPAFVGATYQNSQTGPATALKWVLLFAAVARALLSPVEPTRAASHLHKYLALIAGFLVLNGLLVSSWPAISLFKTLSFTVGLLGIARLALQNVTRNAEMLLFASTAGATVTLTSTPLIGIGLGHSINATGFNGVLNHPQALGIFLAMTGAASFAAAAKIPQLGRILALLGACQWLMIYFTASRTAMIAVVAGIGCFLLESAGRRTCNTRLNFALIVALLLAIPGLLLMVETVPAVTRGFSAFLVKGHDEAAANLDDPFALLVHSSRAAQIADALETARTHPLFGLGFGIDDGLAARLDDPAFSRWMIPLTAPVEQGFLPIATVAQLGFAGLALIFPFVLILYGQARQASALTAALFTTAIGVNFGEMIFYSVGGMGMYLWILLMLAAAGGPAFHAPPLRRNR
jgi:hypothetical protein